MRLFWAAAVATPFAACSGSGSLAGSLGDAYRIDYESVRARLYDSELAIEYVTVQESVPVRVTVRRDDVRLRAGTRVDLGNAGDITGRQVDGTEIPEFEDGTLTLDEYGESEGSRVSGSFDAKLRAGTDRLTLNGEFDTRLEVVEWPPQ